MWIKGVRIENIGPIKKIDLKLKLGSVGIFGSNGAGKSTLIDTIYACITNDFKRFPCDKADLVNMTAEPKSQAYVEVDIEHDGRDFTIRRALKGKTPHMLTFHGATSEKTQTDSRVIADELIRIGIDKKILDFAIFKPQNKIYDFIDVIPSVRGKAYQALNHTEECEALHEVLGEVIKKYGGVSAVVDDTDELVQRIDALKAEREEIKKSKAEHEGNYLLPEHKSKAEAIVEKDRRFLQQSEEKARLDEEIKSLYDTLQPLIQTEAKRWTQVCDLTREKHELEPKAKEAQVTIKRWEAVELYRARKLRIEKKAAELEEARNRIPAKPGRGEPTEAEIQGMRVHLGRLTAELVEAQARHKKLTGGTLDKPLDSCPLCGHDIDAKAGAYAEAFEKVVRLPSVINQWENDIKAKEDLRRLYADRKAKIDIWDVHKKNNDEALASLKEEVEPTESLQEMQAIVARFTDLENRLKNAQDHHAKADKEKMAAWAKYEAAVDRNKTVEQEMDTSRQSEEKINRAKDRLAEDRAARLEVSRLEGRISEFTSRINEATADLTRLRARLKAARRAVKLSAFLERAREVAHRDGLPQKVAQANLHRMEADINAGLTYFGNPFWIEADTDLTFIAHKPGGTTHSAGLLSGGQKMVLAVAFWNAVASMYKADMGMLVLDEPTANLDAENVAGLAEAMSAFTGKVRGRRQLIMVTHADALRPAFDQVIAL